MSSIYLSRFHIALSDAKEAIANGKQWCAYVLHKHTDVISSVGILAITTCLLAAKIFPMIPSVIPRLARVIFNFGGIIWLNVQVRDFLKSGRDFFRAMKEFDSRGLVETSAKIFVKGTNVLLTCAYFAASVVAFCGAPQISMGIYMGLRPLGLVSLGMGILNDVWDYFTNETLLKEMKLLENDGERIVRLVKRFLEHIIGEERMMASGDRDDASERRLVTRLVRQLDMHTMETFQENVGEKVVKDMHVESVRVYETMKDSMINKQVGTRANLNLTALGYAAMGICRAYPDSLIEVAVRWVMSALYTAELLRYKLFQHHLARVLSEDV